MLPSDPVFVDDGLPGLMWLNALYASTRNCASSDSRIGKFFCSERSVLKYPGPMKLFRPTLPIVSSGACVNELVSDALKYPRLWVCALNPVRCVCSALRLPTG